MRGLGQHLKLTCWYQNLAVMMKPWRILFDWHQPSISTLSPYQKSSLEEQSV
jgi:hypothetical protein